MEIYFGGIRSSAFEKEKKGMLTKELPLIFINNSQSEKGLTDEDAWTFTKIQQEKVERLEKAKQKTGKHRAGVTWGKENSDGSKVIEVWEKNTEGKKKGHNLLN